LNFEALATVEEEVEEAAVAVERVKVDLVARCGSDGGDDGALSLAAMQDDNVFPRDLLRSRRCRTEARGDVAARGDGKEATGQLDLDASVSADKEGVVGGHSAVLDFDFHLSVATRSSELARRGDSRRTRGDSRFALRFSRI